MRKKLDNRGSSMIVIIIVIAFVSILISTLFMMSLINIQMKGVDRESKENFYSAEGALDQITVGLQKDLSVASANAYALVMQQYTSTTLEVERREIFNDKLLADLNTTLSDGGAIGQYKISYLQNYLSDEIVGHVNLDSDTHQIVKESDSLVLKDLEVTFTDDAGYQSVIETDIRVAAPNLNLVQPSDMPDVFDYSIVANEQLLAASAGNVTIEAGVYAGDNGLTLTSGAVWDFKQADHVIVSGNVDIPNTASLSTTTDMDLWAKEINVMGGTLASRGRTYVANDLTMSGQGSNVTLAGEYYGYGNGQMLTDAGVTLAQGGDSSAILINGTDTTLDMSSIRRLLLSGSAQIATGDVVFDSDDIEGVLPENEPSLDTLMSPAVISSGSYYLQSEGNGKIVCSAEEYVLARTEAGSYVGQGSWELLSIVSNADNTISLKDRYNNDQYFSVQTDNQSIVTASADTIGPNEKFYPYVYTENDVDYFALKSYANGKFVSIDTYYPADGGEVVTDVLCANRDKVTDDAQLFTVNRMGELPKVVVEPEPAVIFNYVNASQVDIVFAAESWKDNNVDSSAVARITYTATDTKGNTQTVTDAAMQQPADVGEKKYMKLRTTYSATGLKPGTQISYTITYQKKDQSWGTVSGSYTHFNGNYGNGGDSQKPQLADGIYMFRLGDDGYYCQVTDYGSGPLKFATTNPSDSTGSWEWFHLINHADGTISLKSQIGNNENQRYVSIQENGDLIANSNTVGVNEKFYVEYIFDQRTAYFQLRTLEGSRVGERVWSVSGEDNQTVVLVQDSQATDTQSYFTFQWWGYTALESTDEEPTPLAPVTSFTYENYRSSASGNVSDVTIRFANPGWGREGALQGQTVTLTYFIEGKSTEAKSVTMPYLTQRRSVSYTIPALEEGDVINYTITYPVTASATSKIKEEKGSYIHRPGYGNTANNKIEMANGIYFIRGAVYDKNKAAYWRSIQGGNDVMDCGKENPAQNDGSWEKFILVNNQDNTISFKVWMQGGKYVSIQPDGTFKPTADTIGIDERFILEPVEGKDGYYRLKTLDISRGEGKYIYIYSLGRTDWIKDVEDRSRVLVLRDKSDNSEEDRLGYFCFEYLEYTSEQGGGIIEMPNKNPVSSMKYHDEESADVSFTSPYWIGRSSESVTLSYEINGYQYTDIPMELEGTRASSVVQNLRNQDRVVYWFTYTYTTAYGATYTRTTAKHVYIHERLYGELIGVNSENTNVNLGESIEVKSNQIAYLVPPECIGVFEGETYIGKNPLSEEEFTQLMSYASNPTKYPDFEIVSFTKEVKGLGKSLDEYRTEGTDGYRTIFVPTTDGTMVYFYVEFDSDNTSAYFRDYYEKNQSALESYMKNYVNEIRLSNYFMRLTTNGNMVYSANGSQGRINLQANVGTGAGLTPSELSGLRNEEEGYQRRFKALSTKLMLDYDELTQAEKVKNLFDNIIRFSETGGDPDSHAFAGIGDSKSYEADGAIALVINNYGGAAFEYDADESDDVCLILATGDVVVKKNFSGIIIARGSVTIDGSVNKITNNQQALYKVLKSVIPDEVDMAGNPITFIEKYFRDGEKYVLDDGSGSVVTDGDYASYSDLITYEDWSKN